MVIGWLLCLGFAVASIDEVVFLAWISASITLNGIVCFLLHDEVISLLCDCH